MGKRSQLLRAIRHSEDTYVFTKIVPRDVPEQSSERLIRRFVENSPALPVMRGIAALEEPGIKNRADYRPVQPKPMRHAKAVALMADARRPILVSDPAREVE